MMGEGFLGDEGSIPDENEKALVPIGLSASNFAPSIQPLELPDVNGGAPTISEEEVVNENENEKTEVAQGN